MSIASASENENENNPYNRGKQGMNPEIIEIVDRLIEQKGGRPGDVIPLLQGIQNAFNYLPEEALERVCEKTEITPSQIFGISTFYTQFRHRPVGQHLIKVCIGTACHVKGAMQVLDAFRRELELNEGEDTDGQGLFTVDKVACLGCCTIAPVVQIDEVTYGHVTPEKVPEVIHDFLHEGKSKGHARHRDAGTEAENQGEIRIGLGSCCIASGSEAVKKELEETLERQHIQVNVKQVGCVGICNQVPLMEIHKPGETPSFYTKITPEQVKGIITSHFKPASTIDRMRNRFYDFFENIVVGDPKTGLERYPADQRDTPVAEFLEEQVNIATEYRGAIKPSDLDEYKKLGGFKALNAVLGQSPQAVIGTLKESGLRGRGGAGFPTGIKWELVQKAEARKKYVICNGDEGDPGAFMDRMLLESYPFRVIEGVIIAGYAVGAAEGIFYIRAEYPLAVKRIREAIEILERENILGKNILDSGFDFTVRIFEGAGAFVCGEETALIASIEGQRGMPRVRPPYPAERGLWDCPTLINNTETFSLVTWILRKGAPAFYGTGSDDSKGTKVFALAGKINRGGLIEVPMGISIRTIVEKIGGGVQNGKKFKAVQIGGPSGGCIPASLADIPIDFESLKEAGAMMGSGGLIVLDETDCMVDIARYFLSFTQDQSCGKCTFCRIGTRKMLEILDAITSGRGKPQDLDALESLAHWTARGSLCGLGKTAPNPVLSTLTHFRDEYEAHIQGKCPTGKCKDLVTYTILDNCNGCTKCAQRCPADAIAMTPYEVHVIDRDKCIKCDICRQVCPVDAVITI
jgi:NADH:ubiquinone oxidoreductase subunit F (NADH-binding)/NADH:ubiquinone oxidoreductase subunit E/NAD-dependent dihydropyrimidine dehydrogenase PreA subunit